MTTSERDFAGGWLDTPCIAGTGRGAALEHETLQNLRQCLRLLGAGPIASAGSDGADKFEPQPRRPTVTSSATRQRWMCLSLENRPLAKGDESMPHPQTLRLSAQRVESPKMLRGPALVSSSTSRHATAVPSPSSGVGTSPAECCDCYDHFGP